MILLCGIPSEPPLRMVAEAAERAGVEALVLNQRDSARVQLTLDVAPERVAFRLQAPGFERDLAAASGAYVRLMDFRLLPEYRDGGRHALHDRARIEAWHALLGDWLESAPCQVMNRLRPSNSNISKPYQAQLIARCGLSTPRTLVTNRPERVAAFQRLCGRVIYKSISAHRSIVRELTQQAAQRLDRIRLLPTQFQEYLPGDDVRVHVVGQATFATLIRSDAVDYRYAAEDGDNASYESLELPGDVADQCRALSSALELPLCGIDFKRTPAGYVCLEVNPAPAFSCYQEQTGQPIAEAIVRELGGGGAGIRRAGRGG